MTSNNSDHYNDILEINKINEIKSIAYQLRLEQ